MPRKITRGKSTFLSIDFLVQLLIYSCSAQEKFTRFISFRVFERNQVLFLFRRNEIKKTEKLSSEAYDSNTIYLWHSHHRQFRYESESQYSKSQLSSKIKPKLQILGTSISIQKSSYNGCITIIVSYFKKFKEKYWPRKGLLLLNELKFP